VEFSPLVNLFVNLHLGSLPSGQSGRACFFYGPIFPQFMAPLTCFFRSPSTHELWTNFSTSFCSPEPGAIQSFCRAFALSGYGWTSSPAPYPVARRTFCLSDPTFSQAIILLSSTSSFFAPSRPASLPRFPTKTDYPLVVPFRC